LKEGGPSTQIWAAYFFDAMPGEKQKHSRQRKKKLQLVVESPCICTAQKDIGREIVATRAKM
jgi:hypothetical protein